MVDAGCLSSGIACRAALTSRVMELRHLSPGKIFGKGVESGRLERRRRRIVDAGCLSYGTACRVVLMSRVRELRYLSPRNIQERIR